MHCAFFQVTMLSKYLQILLTCQEDELHPSEVPFLVYELEDASSASSFRQAFHHARRPNMHGDDPRDAPERRVCPDDGKSQLG